MKPVGGIIFFSPVKGGHMVEKEFWNSFKV